MERLTMDENGKGILGRSDATAEQIRQAWEYAALMAMEEHRKAGVPVAIWDWETSRVVLVSANEFPMPGVQSLAGKTATNE